MRQLKLRRAPVHVPAEFLKALVNAGAIDSESWLLKLMQLCWDTKTVHTEWHVAKVIPVYKS